jgi:hypothetical protein
MRRHWYRNNSNGLYWRNCPLISWEETLPRNLLLPWRRAALGAEWDETFRRGVTYVTEIGPHDTWESFDDSPEATDAWVKGFLASNGKGVRLR